MVGRSCLPVSATAKCAACHCGFINPRAANRCMSIMSIQMLQLRLPIPCATMSSVPAVGSYTKYGRSETKLSPTRINLPSPRPTLLLPSSQPHLPRSTAGRIRKPSLVLPRNPQAIALCRGACFRQLRHLAPHQLRFWVKTLPEPLRPEVIKWATPRIPEPVA